MEEKLTLYRRQKSRQLWKTKIKNTLASLFLTTLSFFSRKHNVSNNQVEEELETDPEDMDSFHNVEKLDIVNLKTFMVFILWFVTYFYFICIEFGAVYFCLSALVFIYFNTRTAKRQKHEISAYSVFNRNCERIDGTFSAEEFEKQLRSGMIL